MKIDSSLPSASRTSVDGKGSSVRVCRSETTDQPQSATVVTPPGQDADEGRTEDIGLERIAEIRQAISDGRLQLCPERIADGLIDSVRELLTDAQS